jgi:hypothetical protein
MKNVPKWFLPVAAVSAVLAAEAAYFTRVAPSRQPLGGEPRTHAAVVAPPVITLAQVAGAERGFGPVIEATLPSTDNDKQTEILNLKTARWKAMPKLEEFGDDVVAQVSWIHTNGVNISAHIWPDGFAACTTYNMRVFPLQTKCWEQTVAEEISGITLWSTNRHSPRKMIPLGSGQPEIYAFRTDEGTFGMLRLVGLSDDRLAVKIRYKLVQSPEEPARTIATR